jgi:hypothetical protein
MSTIDKAKDVCTHATATVLKFWSGLWQYLLLIAVMFAAIMINVYVPVVWLMVLTKIIYLASVVLLWYVPIYQLVEYFLDVSTKTAEAKAA